jgi:hypothetical protein
MPRQISPERKTLYRAGQIVAVVGLLTFLSVFVSGALHFGDFSNFESDARSMGLRAVGGMLMIIAGMAMLMVGAAGAAGSGLNLDPEKARGDLEPWARLQGGLTKTSLEEMGVDIPKITEALAGKRTETGETFEERLRGLHALYNDGILSEAEYRREKQELLDRE